MRLNNNECIIVIISVFIKVMIIDYITLNEVYLQD